MKIPVFVSFPNPHTKEQLLFIQQLKNMLIEKDLEPRTLGISDYDLDAPLRAIRRLMMESYGIIGIAFKRTLIKEGVFKAYANIEGITPQPITEKWITSPFCQIEPAMAFQMGLPIMLLREKDVIEDGIFEKGVLGAYLPQFDITDPKNNYLNSEEWKQMFGKWERQVKSAYEKKGEPPRLY